MARRPSDRAGQAGGLVLGGSDRRWALCESFCAPIQGDSATSLGCTGGLSSWSACSHHGRGYPLPLSPRLGHLDGVPAGRSGDLLVCIRMEAPAFARSTPAAVSRSTGLRYLLTFALGTAGGDLTALPGAGRAPVRDHLRARFFLPPLARRWIGFNAVPPSGGAYILTRPLGASFAD